MASNEKMIKALQIKGFKRYKDIQFNDLNRINLFLGNNNTGKTTILEAIFAFFSGRNVGALLGNSIGRRTGNISGPYDFIERLLSLHRNQNAKPFSFSISATLVNGKNHSYEHSLDPYGIFADFKPTLMGSFGNPQMQNTINMDLNGNQSLSITSVPVGKWKVRENNKLVMEIDLDFPPLNPKINTDPFLMGRFVDILTHRDQSENTKIYSFLKRQRIMDEFIDELQHTFPNILDIDSIPYPDGSPSPVSFKVKDKQLLPMYNFGDGVQRWYNILGGMILYQNAFHCIEEIDATFHPTAQRDLARNIFKYANQFNNQLFMTTHSIEFVDNLLQSIYEDEELAQQEDIVRIITLKNNPENDEVYTRVLTGREAYETREKYQLELR